MQPERRGGGSVGGFSGSDGDGSVGASTTGFGTQSVGSSSVSLDLGIEFVRIWSMCRRIVLLSVKRIS